ncbi:YitT family protein [bacterium]|nr:YitT family protein [bacterium]
MPETHKKFVLKLNWKKELFDAGLILVGTAICGIAYVMFLIPHHVVSGGVGGISIILNYVTKWSVSIFYVVLNIPIFILGVKDMGMRYGIKSLAGILATSGFIYLFDGILHLPSVTNEPILGAAYGGAILGLGLGIVFRGHGSTGGTDIIGQVLTKRSNISVGGWILIFDILVIATGAIVFRTLEAPLFGFLSLIINTKVIDLVLEGFSYARAAYIITTKPQEVSWAVSLEMRRGATALHGHSYFSGERREVLYIVLTRREIDMLKQIVKQIDPKAFVVISDVYEVLGKGFRARN